MTRPDPSHIDDLFRIAFDRHRPTPSPDQWEQAYALLQELKYRKRKKRILLLLTILTAGVLSAYLLYRQTSAPTPSSPTPPLAHQTIATNPSIDHTIPSDATIQPTQPNPTTSPQPKRSTTLKKQQPSKVDRQPKLSPHSGNHTSTQALIEQSPAIETPHTVVFLSTHPLHEVSSTTSAHPPSPLSSLPNIQSAIIPIASRAWSHDWHRSYGIAFAGPPLNAWEFFGGLESEWSWRKSWHIAIGINAVYLYDGRDRDLIVNQPVYGLQKSYRRYSIDLVHINAIAVPFYLGYHFPKFGLRTGIVYHFPFASFGFINGLESKTPFTAKGWIHPKYLNRQFTRLSVQCLIPWHHRQLSIEVQYGKGNYLASVTPQPLWSVRLGLRY